MKSMRSEQSLPADSVDVASQHETGLAKEGCGSCLSVLFCPCGAEMLTVHWFPIGLHLLCCSWPAAPSSFSSSFSSTLNQLTDAADQLPQHTAAVGVMWVCVCEIQIPPVGLCIQSCLNNLWVICSFTQEKLLTHPQSLQWAAVEGLIW